MSSQKFLFVGYCDRSGSTFLLNELNKIEGVTVCPELDLLVRLLLKKPFKKLTKYFIKRFYEEISSNAKFRFWDMDLSTIKSLYRIELFFEILLEYSKKINQDNRLIVFKERSILGYYDVLSSYPNTYFLGLIRDPRAIYLSQKNNVNSVQNRVMSNNPLTTIKNWEDLCERVFEIYQEPNFLQIRYEDLIANKEMVISRIIRFLFQGSWVVTYKQPNDLQTFYDKSSSKFMLVDGLPQKDRINAWVRELSTDEIAFIENSAKEYLKYFGYNGLSPLKSRSKSACKYFIKHVLNVIYWRCLVIKRRLRFMGLISNQ